MRGVAAGDLAPDDQLCTLPDGALDYIWNIAPRACVVNAHICPQNIGNRRAVAKHIAKADKCDTRIGVCDGLARLVEQHRHVLTRQLYIDHRNVGVCLQ